MKTLFSLSSYDRYEREGERETERERDLIMRILLVAEIASFTNRATLFKVPRVDKNKERGLCEQYCHTEPY